MSGVVTVIQARTGSTRLPGKVLLPLGDRTVLEVMLERVLAAGLVGTVVVATTQDAADDPIEAIAAENDVPCYRGSATDLLDRHYRAAGECQASYVVKIPSDCPIIDPAVIDDVLGFFLERDGQLDFASNLLPPTHPDGNDVEVMTFAALETAWHEATQPYEREHTTPFIWSQPERFRLANVVWAAHPDCSRSHRVVLDFPEDYDVIQSIYAELSRGNPLFPLDDVVDFLDAHPQLMARNARHRGIHWYGETPDQLRRSQSADGDHASAA